MYLRSGAAAVASARTARTMVRMAANRCMGILLKSRPSVYRRESIRRRSARRAHGRALLRRECAHTAQNGGADFAQGFLVAQQLECPMSAHRQRVDFKRELLGINRGFQMTRF